MPAFSNNSMTVWACSLIGPLQSNKASAMEAFST